MAFRYQLYNIFSYENIELVAQVKLKFYRNQIDQDNVVMANYQNKLEYFYAKNIFSDDENFNIYDYLQYLPIINIENYTECRDISEICLNRKMGTLENFLYYKKSQEELFSTFLEVTTTTSTSTTSTTITTTPCPIGVPSRIYYIDATNICAICVATNEFVCSPYENYNYVNCLNSINSYNKGNINCTTTPESTTPIP
jgi:hypothetical protein